LELRDDDEDEEEKKSEGKDSEKSSWLLLSSSAPLSSREASAGGADDAVEAVISGLGFKGLVTGFAAGFCKRANWGVVEVAFSNDETWELWVVEITDSAAGLRREFKTTSADATEEAEPDSMSLENQVEFQKSGRVSNSEMVVGIKHRT
jgi:hypothetical protein